LVLVVEAAGDRARMPQDISRARTVLPALTATAWRWVVQWQAHDVHPCAASQVQSLGLTAISQALVSAILSRCARWTQAAAGNQDL